MNLIEYLLQPTNEVQQYLPQRWLILASRVLRLYRAVTLTSNNKPIKPFLALIKVQWRICLLLRPKMTVTMMLPLHQTLLADLRLSMMHRQARAPRHRMHRKRVMTFPKSLSH
jgi:hypothetical protein